MCREAGLVCTNSVSITRLHLICVSTQSQSYISASIVDDTLNKHPPGRLSFDTHDGHPFMHLSLHPPVHLTARRAMSTHCSVPHARSQAVMQESSVMTCPLSEQLNLRFASQREVNTYFVIPWALAKMSQNRPTLIRTNWRLVPVASMPTPSRKHA